MSRRPRGAGNTRGGRGGGRGGGGGGIAPPVLEAPLLIPGLMAWFDSRSTDYFALGGGGEVSAWLSRAGSLGAIAWQQGVGSNQPIRVPSEPLFNNMPAVRLDGVNDWLDASSPTAGTRLHNGLGGSTFRLVRIDSTGGATQRLFSSANNATQVGMLHQASATSLTIQVLNGSGVVVNSWSFSAAAHYARDVSRWQMSGYVTGMMHSRVSGSSLTNADTGGPPSASDATFPLRLGASPTGTSPTKGLLPQELYYDHVLTAGETTQLANFFAPIYGVAA